MLKRVTMERLTKYLTNYWPGCETRRISTVERRMARELRQRQHRESKCAFLQIAWNCYERVEKTITSDECLSRIVLFNIFFWGFLALEVRGILAASSAALALAIAYGRLGDTDSDDLEFSARMMYLSEEFAKIVRFAKWLWNDYIWMMYQKHRIVFYMAALMTLATVWTIIIAIGCILFAYVMCMLCLLMPSLIDYYMDDSIMRRYNSTNNSFLNRESDAAMEDFLPTITEDNLHVLDEAGESGMSGESSESGESTESAESAESAESTESAESAESGESSDSSSTSDSSSSDSFTGDDYDEHFDTSMEIPAHDQVSTDDPEETSDIEHENIRSEVSSQDSSSSSDDEADPTIEEIQYSDVELEVIRVQENESDIVNVYDFDFIDSDEVAELKSMA